MISGFTVIYAFLGSILSLVLSVSFTGVLGSIFKALSPVTFFLFVVTAFVHYVQERLSTKRNNIVKKLNTSRRTKFEICVNLSSRLFVDPGSFDLVIFDASRYWPFKIRHYVCGIDSIDFEQSEVTGHGCLLRLAIDGERDYIYIRAQLGEPYKWLCRLKFLADKKAAQCDACGA